MRWLLLVLIAIAGLGPLQPHLANVNAETKMTIIGVYNFTALSSYMYNSTASLLQPVDTSKAIILADEIKDLAAGDGVNPVILLDLDAPTHDLNNNETIIHAYILSNTYGALVIGVADVNSTNVTNLQFIKVSPVAGDVAVIRTASDITVYANGIKMSIPLTNYTNPRTLVMVPDEGTYLMAASIQEVELRSVNNPPSGYNLLRTGTGETEFTITATGQLSIWFDESHEPGDIDLFVFDSANSAFSDASTSQSWAWLVAHASTYLFADGGPETRTITSSGQVKFVAKLYRGTEVSGWRVAARLSSDTSPQPQPSIPEQTTTTSTANPTGLLAQIQGAYEANPVAFIVIVVIAILILVMIFRR